MSKLSSQTNFVVPNVALSVDQRTLFLFHRNLADAQRRSRLESEVQRFQAMSVHVMDVSAVYAWLRRVRTASAALSEGSQSDGCVCVGQVKAGEHSRC